MVSKKTVGARLDKLARDICKLKADYTCARCGIVGDGSMIQWAHIEGRRKKGGMLRWDQNNCLPLCAGPFSNSCHYWFDNNKVASTEWLKKNYPKKYEWLTELVDGKPRSEQYFTESVDEMLELEKKLIRVRARYK